MKRQQRTIGSIVKIDLGDGYHSYAQILHAELAFFDLKVKEEITDLNTLLTCPVLFITEVYNDAITKGRWQKVGKLPIREELQVVPMQFIQDTIDPTRFRIYDPNTGAMRPALKSECAGLESASVWEPEAIEERIRNYYDGVPNQYLEADKKVFSTDVDSV